MIFLMASGSVIILSSVRLAAALNGYFSLTAHLTGPYSPSLRSATGALPSRVYDLKRDKIV